MDGGKLSPKMNNYSGSETRLTVHQGTLAQTNSRSINKGRNVS